MNKLAKTNLIFTLVAILIISIIPKVAGANNLTVKNLLITNIQDDEVTISWSTDQPSFYLLQYGTSINYDRQLKGLTASVYHELNLRGLKPATTYHFQIISYTATDQRTVTFDQVFKTKKFQDNEKPEMLQSRIPLITAAAAYFRFLTNEPVSGKILFWPQDNIKKTGSKNFNSHNDGWSNVTIKSLRPATTYVYTITFQDKAGNTTKYNEKTFTTEGSDFQLGDLAINRLEPLDINSPLIGEDKLTVKFQTTRPASCSLTIGGRTIKDPNYYDWSHSLTVTNLKPGHSYQYYLKCTDFLGKKIKSHTYYVTTKSPRVLGYTITKPPAPFGGKKFTVAKESGTDRVYVLLDKQKYYIRNPEIFLSYGLDKIKIEVLTSDQLAKYPTARVVVSETTGEKYFLYLDKNMKKKIFSDTVNKSYHFNKNYRAIIINEVDLNQYLDLWLIKTTDSPAVYLIQNGVKRPIASWETFLNNRWQEWQIGLVNQTDLDSYITGSTLR